MLGARLALCIALISAAATAAIAGPPQVFRGPQTLQECDPDAKLRIAVFGDSLVDNGNMFRETGGQFPPPDVYWKGRASNGPVFPEVAATLLGSYLRGGVCVDNFAFFSAQARPLSGAGRALLSTPERHSPTLDEQMSAFERARAAPRAYSKKRTAVNPPWVAVVSVGANDYTLSARRAQRNLRRIPKPEDVVGAIVGATFRFIDARLREDPDALVHVVWANLMPGDRTPFGRSLGQRANALARKLFRQHNDLLVAEAQRLTQYYRHSAEAETRVRVSVFDLNQAVVQMMGSFPNVKTSFLGIDEQAQSEKLTPDATDDALPDSPPADRASAKSFLFFDQIHPTANAHAQLGEMLFYSIVDQGDLITGADDPVDVVDEDLWGLGNGIAGSISTPSALPIFRVRARPEVSGSRASTALARPLGQQRVRSRVSGSVPWQPHVRAPRAVPVRTPGRSRAI